VNKRGKSKDYGKTWFVRLRENMVCVENKIKRKKSGDTDDCAAQHGAKPHGEWLQRHPDAGHGIAHEADIIGR
jgi:hypothetical protein